eukprot:1026725-Rhodomonas_salina.3
MLASRPCRGEKAASITRSTKDLGNFEALQRGTRRSRRRCCIVPQPALEIIFSIDFKLCTVNRDQSEILVDHVNSSNFCTAPCTNWYRVAQLVCGCSSFPLLQKRLTSARSELNVSKDALSLCNSGLPPYHHQRFGALPLCCSTNNTAGRVPAA